MKDGWKDLGNGQKVFVENGLVVRAMNYSGRSASVYKWDRRLNCRTNACPIKYETFCRGWREDRYLIQ